jgi:hypothetical protein
MPYARGMKTAYRGHARIGDFHADVDITNVDVLQWKGTATDVHGTGPTPPEAIVTLLDQPRPGWSARAEACEADGVLHLDGIDYFHGPERSVVAPGPRSRWVRKLPPGT